MSRPAAPLFLAFPILASSFGAEDAGDRSPSPPPSIEQLAERSGLTATDVARLRRDKILIGNETFKQVFTPYIERRMPLFITSDSLLNAFHVLYEESILQLETANAPRLKGILRSLWKALDGAGAGLKGSWLQSIPHRVDRDEELLAILIIGDAASLRGFAGDAKAEEELRAFFGQFREILGAGDDWDILLAAEAASEPGGRLELDLDDGRSLAAKRSLVLRLGEKLGPPEINDAVRLPPLRGEPAAEPNIRVIAAHRTPDAVLFHRTTDYRKFPDRGFPSGLEVPIALGSVFARAALVRQEPRVERIFATTDGAREFFRGKGLYVEYLQCLSALLDPPDPGAPAFLAGAAWQAKSCQAAPGRGLGEARDHRAQGDPRRDPGTG